MRVVKKSSFLVECFPVGRMNEGGWLERSAEGYRTRYDLYKMPVTVLLFSLVESIVVRIIDMGGVWIWGG